MVDAEAVLCVLDKTISAMRLFVEKSKNPHCSWMRSRTLPVPSHAWVDLDG